MARKFLSSLYHFCWYALASVIILAAVSITVLRMALPDIGQYREDIQIWVSQYMGHPVEIRDINADWEGWIPNLYLDEIRVLNSDNQSTMVSFERASVTLNLYSSLKKREFVPHNIRVSGLELSLIRHEDGSVTLSSAQDDQSLTNNSRQKNELGQWFRKQKHIEIDRVSINWVDEKNRLPRVHFENASIKLLSDENRMQISGTATSRQYFHTATFQYALDIFGHLHTTNWSGQAYLEIDQLEPGYWNDYFKIDRLKLGNTAGKIKLWSDWKETKLTRLDTELLFSSIEIQEYMLDSINGRISLTRKQNDDWLLSLNLQEFTTPEGSWPGLDAEFDIPSPKHDKERLLKSYVKYVKLDDVFNLATNFGLSTDLGLAQYSIGGDLENLTLNIDLDNPTERYWLDSGVQHLVVHEKEGIHLSGISGHLTMQADSGQFQIDADKSEFNMNGLYEQAIWFYNTGGTVSWNINNGSTVIIANQLKSQTSDFDFSFTSKVSFNNEKDTHLDLLLNIDPVAIDTLLEYIPKSDSAELSTWLRQSLLGGRLLNTDVVIRGPVSAIPYTNNEGLLQIITQVENTTLDYDPEWPPIDKLNAELIFNNNSLKIIADSGYVFSSVLSDTVATIPDLTTDKPHVLLQGHFDGTTRDSALFIRQSPLSDIAALDIIKNEELKGPLQLDLNLDIPLYDKDTSIIGKLELPGNQLNSSRIGVNLTDLKGQINFTRDSIQSKKLRGQYFGREVELELTKDDDPASEEVAVKLSGTMDRDFLRKQFNHYFPNSTVMVNDYIEHLSGASTWQAELNLGSDDNSNQLFIHSDLVGMKVELPPPLAKDKTSILPVTLSTSLDSDTQQLLDIQIGNVFAARLEYSESGENIIDALKVNFGGELAQLTSAEGISINGQVEQLSLSDWVNLIKKNMQQGTSTSRPGHENVNVAVRIARLEFFNQMFTDVDLNIEKNREDWQINIKSDAIAGLVSIPTGENVIVLDLTHLHLTDNESNETRPDTDFNPSTVPSIHAHVENVSYGDKELGEMYLETSRLKNGLSFDELTFNKTGLEINGFGQWVRENNENVSRFNFDLSANELNTMLATFKFTDAAIKDGVTNINLEAEWAGRPVDFSLDNINGQLDMLIERGQFLDINPKAGRLFGLLSLQTLPRRLSLDFTDLFGEGLSFDTIQGVFTINNGNAYTNNLTMTGPSANIAVTGRTGLIDKDYDQVVTITPQISDSLPVASALFGPIGVGVGAVIYFASELFESIPDQIDKILQYQYTITGSWEEPEVREIKANASS